MSEARRLQKEYKPIEHRPSTLGPAGDQLAILCGDGEDRKELEISLDIRGHAIDSQSSGDE